MNMSRGVSTAYAKASTFCIVEGCQNRPVPAIHAGITPTHQRPLRPEVKDFIHARCLTSAKPLAPYKKTIQASLYPDVVHGEDLDLARGQQAISDYKKATNDPLGTLDLMVYYVECGTQFAVEYSYGDEEFFEGLDAMFTQVVKTLQKSDEPTVARLLPRLATVVRQAEDIGWGYYDAISDTLEGAFPEGR